LETVPGSEARGGYVLKGRRVGSVRAGTKVGEGRLVGKKDREINPPNREKAAEKLSADSIREEM